VCEATSWFAKSNHWKEITKEEIIIIRPTNNHKSLLNLTIIQDKEELWISILYLYLYRTKIRIILCTESNNRIQVYKLQDRWHTRWHLEYLIRLESAPYVSNSKLSLMPSTTRSNKSKEEKKRRESLHRSFHHPVDTIQVWSILFLIWIRRLRIFLHS